ncbi:MAG: hypothetical protein ACE14P_00265 [Methanotrichaceae archaeon]
MAKGTSNPTKEFPYEAWLSIPKMAIILLIFQITLLAQADPTQVIAGKTYTISGPAAPNGEIYSYHWMITAGTPQTSSDASFLWTSPQIKETTQATINLTVRSNKAICPGKSELDLLIIPGSQPKISLKKDCIFTPPVRVGDLITYTYNVTNSGDAILTDINLTDIHNWGPDCRPIYAIGDDGDGVLNPGETWRYECKYIVPDPSDYQQLHIMSDNSSEGAVTQRLIEMKGFLERKMDSLKYKRQRFNTKLARLNVDHRLLNGSNFTLYNYTNQITGESLSQWLDTDGRIRRSDYYDPVTQAMLTSEYNSDGNPKSDSILLLSIKEYLKIEYDISSNIYKNFTTGYTRYTIIDYNTGDTLILLVHFSGKIVSKEYRKTPGYKPYEEKLFLKNTALVTAKAPDGNIVSDMDSFSLEIYKKLPVLRGLNIIKNASRSIVKAGGTLTYTINYNNTGHVTQTNAIIDDSLDDNVIFLSSSPQPTGNLGGGHFQWKVGDLKMGANGTISIDIRVSDKAPDGNIFNNCRISSGNQTKNATLNTKVVSSLWITKNANRTSYSPGDNVLYTISYGNHENETAHDVIITDILPKVELVSVSPSPTSINGSTIIWKIGDLPPSEDGTIQDRTIQIIAHIPERPDMKFNEESSVKGEGYVYVNKKLSTAEENTALINSAYISGYYKKDSDIVWDNKSASVTILGPAGTELSTSEHGSGYYKEDGTASLRSKYHSITLDKDITVQHNNTAFSLPGGRDIKYNSLWSDRTVAKNHILNDVVSEDYLYMNSIDKKSSFTVDMNQTVYQSESDFSGGIAQIQYEKHYANSPITTAEINENYHGSFKVLESVDSYGESTRYKKSAKGSGFVSSDKRPGPLQRSYEYGSGYYNSEEASQLDLVTKSSKMAYAPENLTAGSVNVSYASLWSEGLNTKDPGLKLILSEKIGFASYINKDAWMDKSTLSFMSEFNGSMDIRAVTRPLEIKTREVDQSFVGNYTINTAISSYVNPKYLYPHVSISKEAIKEDESTILFLINVTNDGNGILGPLYVTDRMPDGLIFMNSSLRPETNGQFINWTIPSLDISRMLTIKLRAKFENDLNPYTNIVKVTAEYNGHILTASNSTSFTPNYLPCCIVSGSYPKELSYLAKVFDVSLVKGEWGDWKPSPCFNMTLEAPDCLKEINEYYNDLDSSESECCPISSYDVP